MAARRVQHRRGLTEHLGTYSETEYPYFLLITFIIVFVLLLLLSEHIGRDKNKIL